MGKAGARDSITGRIGARLAKTIQDLRQSYWLIPAGLTMMAVGLAWAMATLDRWLGDVDWAGPAIEPEAARTVLTLIAQSIIGVTGVMFSMTVVAVSFAAGKFGPRLIGNFMRDRVNQWSLGILVATFVFALLVARGVTGEFVPNVSLLLAVTLTLLCIAVVIYFVHHIPETIDISQITAGLGGRLLAGVKAEADRQAAAGPGGFVPSGDIPPDAEVTMNSAGYIVSLDVEALRDFAAERSLRIDAPRRVGNFVSGATVVLRLWGTTGLDDEDRAMLRRCIALGSGPREEENLIFLFDQLVEITARALSPGVNDPFTAINCVNWMQAGTLAAACHAEGLTGRQEGPVRVPTATFAQVLDAGFAASRPYTASDPLADAHVRRMLDRLDDEVPKASPHRPTLDAFLTRMRAVPRPDAADDL